MNSQELRQEASRHVVMVISEPTHIYMDSYNGMSARQRRKHEQTRKRKGRV